jgi:hypothetical protein
MPVVPDVNVFNMPFVFRNEAHMRAVIDGPIDHPDLNVVERVSRPGAAALRAFFGGKPPPAPDPST